MTKRIHSNVIRRGLLTHRPIFASESPSPLIDRIILFRARWSALRIAVHTFWGGLESTKKQRWLAGIIVDQYEAHIPPTDPSTPQSRQFIEITPDAPYIDEMLLQIMMNEFELSLKTATRTKS
ncbi:hypothetical protein EDD17DRAFT_1869053 [Pisolithus thermaeus]|nr:hypothetical protein EV401DRAFT_1551288 [Pisolithus croceorrhizus]KAI6168281.1 hypothetical protein EDD17DRAFT_1869053 [Pisolithus thermaeus]